MASGTLESKAILPVNTAAKTRESGPKPSSPFSKPARSHRRCGPHANPRVHPDLSLLDAGCAGPRPSTPSKSYFRTDAFKAMLASLLLLVPRFSTGSAVGASAPAPRPGHPLGSTCHLRNKLVRCCRCRRPRGALSDRGSSWVAKVVIKVRPACSGMFSACETSMAESSRRDVCSANTLALGEALFSVPLLRRLLPRDPGQPSMPDKTR